MPIPNNTTLTYRDCQASLGGLNVGKNVPHNETPDAFYARFLAFSDKKGRIIPSDLTTQLQEHCAELISRRAGIRPAKRNLELFVDDTPLPSPTSLNPKLHQMLLWAEDQALRFSHPQDAVCACYREHGTACLGSQDSITFRRRIASLWGLRSVPSLATPCDKPHTKA